MLVLLLAKSIIDFVARREPSSAMIISSGKIDWLRAYFKDKDSASSQLYVAIINDIVGFKIKLIELLIFNISYPHVNDVF